MGAAGRTLTSDFLHLAQIKAGELQLKLRAPFHGEEPVSVRLSRQMLLLLTDRAVYYVPRAQFRLKKFFSFAEPCRDSLLFQVGAKVFVLRISARFEMKVFATLKSLELAFLFKVQLKRYSGLEFFEKDKVLVLWHRRKVFALDLKKVLLKRRGGYTGFRVQSDVVQAVGLEAFAWGFQVSLLSVDGVLRKVGRFGWRGGKR